MYGFSIVGASNTLSGNNASRNGNAGFYTAPTGNGNVYTNNIASLNTYYGFLLYGPYSSTFSGNTANLNDGYGFLLSGSSYNTFTGDTASLNKKDGFYLTDSGYNTFSGVNASLNGEDGFSLERASYNILSGNTASGNTGNGFDLRGSGFVTYNTVTGNTASGNLNGFYLLDAKNNNFTANTASNNMYDGFNLTASSNDNTINGNYITNNGGYGISIQNSYNNTIYNNYFNNDRNARVSYITAGEGIFSTLIPANNTWNVTPVPGPNIIGGPYIGGNYWATPGGTGWSQTHPDTGNGFAEPYNITAPPGSNYTVNGNGVIPARNIDYHPLVVVTPAPTPTPSGSFSVVIPPSPDIPLPWNSAFTANDIPENMQPCTSYNTPPDGEKYRDDELVIGKRGHACLIIFEWVYL